jgi:hypothetical protein
VTEPTTQLTGFRAAEQASFDQVVVQSRGRILGYDVRSVPALTQDPPASRSRCKARRCCGRPAARQHQLRAWRWPRPVVRGHHHPRLVVPQAGQGGRRLRGPPEFGPGLDHRVAFGVLALTDPSRVVIDVAPAPAPRHRSQGSGPSTPGRRRGSFRTRSNRGTSPGGAPPTDWWPCTPNKSSTWPSRSSVGSMPRPSPWPPGPRGGRQHFGHPALHGTDLRHLGHHRRHQDRPSAKTHRRWRQVDRCQS